MSDILSIGAVLDSKNIKVVQEPRALSTIAYDIRRHWANVNYAAVPYLDAMTRLDSISDRYGYDDARSIVLYFLSNARAWRGPDAKRIKAELKALLGSK